MDFEGDKETFCAAYKENRESLAERIRDAANKKELKKKDGRKRIIGSRITSAI